MKERPILFSSPMVRAILDGRKTQTRRVVNPKLYIEMGGPEGLAPIEQTHLMFGDLCRRFAKCPYGQPGDRLWVRETWQPGTWGPSYRADFTEESARRCLNPWKPCIHMPRRFSRITLEVTEVRVQRLQDISPEDILDEGVDNGSSNPTMGERWANMQRMAWTDLWDSINGQREGAAWADNPWVWAVSFRRLP